MSFFKSKGFKYIKNLIIGVGAAVVLLGALFKIQSWPYASEMLTVGLVTEAGLFLMLGLLGPEKDYYWEKLYPGLDKYNSDITAIEVGGATGGSSLAALDGDRVDRQLEGMLTELQTMSRSMSSLKALQEVDFSGTSEQIRRMSDFYADLNEAMANIKESVDDTRQYKEQLAALNQNLGSLNSVYGGMLSAMANIGGPRN